MSTADQLEGYDPERFWAKVDRRGPDDCWVWRGWTHSSGYGEIRRLDRLIKVHRVSYYLEHGHLDDSLFVLHSCDNKPCVNPAHLRQGTPADNARDRDTRGRMVPLPGSKNGAAKLNEDDVLYIRSLEGRTLQSIADEFQITKQAIWMVRQRKTWQHV